MILTCPACQTRYQADASKFPPQGRDVRCARCGHVWHQEPPEPEPDISFPPLPEPPPPPSYQPEVPEPEVPQPEAYAEPEPRDEEPHYQEETVAPAKAPSNWPRRLALGTGWLVWAGAVAALCLAAVIFRETVVRAWPKTASFYAAVGLKVDDSGLRIGSLKWQIQSDGNQTVGTLSGSIANIAERELPVPQVRAALLDGEKHEIYHWVFAPEVMTLRPGQAMRFETRVSSPPDGARDLEVRFVRAGE